MHFNLLYISPELILAAGGILALMVGLATPKWSKPGRVGLFSVESVSVTVLLAALAATAQILVRPEIGTNGVAQFGGLMAVDGLAVFFKLIAIVSTGIVVLLSVDFFSARRFHRGEYYALLIFATLAICSLAASTDMIMIYLSLEFLSITSYILVGYLKQDPRSNEAAVKYFLYGSIAAAVMIYGMTMIYGMSGSTNILSIAAYFKAHPASYPMLFISTLLILVGLGFKIAMVPFHQWSPDTYQGAPTPITAFLSVGSKAAGFAVLMRVLGTGITAVGVFNWTPLIMVLAGVTMTVGNLIAIPQTSMKRMLAYSSIAQAGYLLLGVATMGVAKTDDGMMTAVQGVLIYIFAYLFMNLGAFGVVTLLSSKLNSDLMSDYSGLVKRAPWAAVAMVFFLLSLAGIPPTAGFVGKFYLFFAAIKTAQFESSTALLWLSVVAIVNTIISVYYYFNVVRLMFFGEAKEATPIPSSGPLNLVIGFTLAMTIIILIFPQPFIDAALASARMLGM